MTDSSTIQIQNAENVRLWFIEYFRFIIGHIVTIKVGVLNLQMNEKIGNDHGSKGFALFFLCHHREFFAA